MNLISLFARHRLAATLTMFCMILAGIWAINHLNVGLNPVRSVNSVSVYITWRGASAEDVEKLITNPLEQQLRSINKVKTVRSATRDTVGHVMVEMETGTDMSKAMDDIKQRVSQIRSFPVNIEPPVIRLNEQRDHVAAILLQGSNSLDELIPLARSLESDLLASGADIVDMGALPQQEIAIQVPARALYEMGQSMNDLGHSLGQLSQDAPGGTIGTGQMSRQLRSLDQRRDATEFSDLPMYSHNGEQLLRLGDIATVEKRPVVDRPYTMVNGEPAVQMMVRKGVESDSLQSARMLRGWVEKVEATLPPGMTISIFAEAWVFIQDEINLILKNGATGLVLVIIALLIFLQFRVAFWVMLGMPVTFLAALLAFYYLGGTINIVSLIGIVMALGIVVDDAIVVGEESLSQFQSGKSPEQAAVDGANRMFAPVVASSLTTLCAFMPLLASDSEEIVEIPIVMMCVIFASLVECFLVLPGHLRHAFEQSQAAEGEITRESRFRVWFNDKFNYFREQQFRPVVRLAMQNRRLVIGAAFSFFALTVGLWSTGWIKTDFSLNINFDEVKADVQFAGGTSDIEKAAFMQHLETTLVETDEALDGDNLVSFMTTRNGARINNEEKAGSQYGSVWVELVSPEKRDVSADDFATAWLAKVQSSHIIDSLTIKKSDGYWGDFAILLKGGDTDTLKQASEELMAELGTLQGVKNLHDDLPYGREQWILSLTTEGRALGLTTSEVGRQLRAAYDGERIQIFQDGQTELEVRVMLPEHERTDLSLLGRFPIKTPAGEMLPLRSVATWEGKRGIDVIRHHNAEKTVKISGDVDLHLLTGREVIAHFDDNVKEALLKKYGLTSGLDDVSLEELEAESTFGTQFLIALTLIFIVLAWIFSSYVWPLAVMAAIPLGLTGALIGHFIMGMVINPMSMLGLFTLTGIIVNDSIILVSTYKRLVEEGVCPNQAIEDAVCLRLRAVILTSVTTIAGLFPLMLEQAPIAAMFTPLATAICFGMLYGTVLVLLVIPALLSSVITITDWIKTKGSHHERDELPAH